MALKRYPLGKDAADGVKMRVNELISTRNEGVDGERTGYVHYI